MASRLLGTSPMKAQMLETKVDITVRRADAAEHQHQRANDAEMLSSHRADNTDGHQTGIKNTSTPREAHG